MMKTISLGILVFLVFNNLKTMEFSAKFTNMIGLTLMLSVFSLFAIINGLYGDSLEMVTLGIVLFAFLIIIRLRFKVRFDDQTLSSTGFFSTKTLKWSEINNVIRMTAYGYPQDRFSGPYVFEFQTQNTHLRINFKLFSVECRSEIMARIKNHQPTT